MPIENGSERRRVLGAERLVRVLIADDTSTIRLLLRRTFEASGRFDVVGEAEDGVQAVERAGELRPDIILLDLSMPVLDGIEAIPLIRERAPEARIVVLSGYSSDGMGGRALAAGADAFLEKNQRPAQLVERLLDAWSSPARP